MTMRLEAYYYKFEPTGVEAIDKILSAVACAGKAYHHTDNWTENTEATNYRRETIAGHLRGATPVDWIQNAANDAAVKMLADAELERLHGQDGR